MLNKFQTYLESCFGHMVYLVIIEVYFHFWVVIIHKSNLCKHNKHSDFIFKSSSNSRAYGIMLTYTNKELFRKHYGGDEGF